MSRWTNKWLVSSILTKRLQSVPIYIPEKRLRGERKIINFWDFLLYGWVESLLKLPCLSGFSCLSQCLTRHDGKTPLKVLFARLRMRRNGIAKSVEPQARNCPVAETTIASITPAWCQSSIRIEVLLNFYFQQHLLIISWAHNCLHKSPA